jgi:hypothetical protein
MLIIGAAIILVAIGGYFAWALFSEPVAVEPTTPEVVAPVNTDVSYASSTMKFSLSYPQGFTVDEKYAYTRVSASKPISGVKFMVPASFTQGTNLAADSGVSMEVLPRATACTGDIYLKANVKAQAMSGPVPFSVATSSDKAGADTFEEAVYAVSSSSPCIAMRYFLHTVNSTSTASTTRAFDLAAVLAAFDKIRASLSVQ